MKNTPPLTDKDFSLFQKLLNDESGLSFDRNRKSSLQAALYRRLVKNDCNSYFEYYKLLKSSNGYPEFHKLFELLTIGETSFFRNTPQFDILLKVVLPEIVQKKIFLNDQSLRIWSAGCSRGNEAYSIAIAVMELLPLHKNWNISILGTDINNDFLLKAEKAVYKKREIEKLSKKYLQKYFQQIDENYILKDNVRKLVNFEYNNLSKGPFSLHKTQNLDIIFCRNVTIYFDTKTTKRIIDSFYHCLNRNGYLFIGHSESLHRINKKFKRVDFPNTIIYKKVLSIPKKSSINMFIDMPAIKVKGHDSVPTETKTIHRKQNIIIKKQSKPSPKPTKAEISNDEQYLDNIGDFLAEAVILANQAEYKKAIEILLKIIKLDNLQIEA